MTSKPQRIVRRIGRVEEENHRSGVMRGGHFQHDEVSE